MKQQNLYIIFKGAPGVGKTTACRLVADHLSKNGFKILSVEHEKINEHEFHTQHYSEIVASLKKP
jgi:nucleoside-triphosphatase THEP1